MYRTEFEEFYSWLIEQKANGNWDRFSNYIDNRISNQREQIMLHLGSLSRENLEAVNSLMESRAIIELLEEIKQLPSTPVSEILAGIDVK